MFFAISMYMETVQRHVGMLDRLLEKVLEILSDSTDWIWCIDDVLFMTITC